ncbi:MAG: PilZ domain-containing protein [Neptuniibacter sp.]
MTEQQRVIHHPEEFSIELQQKKTPYPISDKFLNLKLVCHSSTPFSSGESVAIHLPTVSNNEEVMGVVEWCNSAQRGFELGIKFSDPNELMRLRMLEQICFIKRYRNHVLHIEGRDLSDQDAALEWIAKYARLFPNVG